MVGDAAGDSGKVWVRRGEEVERLCAGRGSLVVGERG